MKKILSIALVVLLALGAFTACGNGNDVAPEGDNGNGETLSGTVVIAGSTSVQPLSEELAAIFMDENPDVSIQVQGGGSGQGVKSIAEDIADFGALSRNVKDEEKSSIGNEIVIAQDGVAVIVNPESSIEDLSMEQIRQIYTGEITNWSEVGGDDAKIQVVSREEGSGTRGAFVEITGVEGDDGDATTLDALVQGSTGAVMQTVANTPNTIGYISLGSLSDTVKAIKVEGVAPSNETILSGDYKIARPFIYVSGTEISQSAQGFLDFIMSADGQAIVEDNGFIPVK
ncbi:MAG: phosphate ABC transporter substrate-binding protein PstS family protein [Anaerovoracaceae bacterium]|jgi:phosphate transport system substrate-binding protein